MYKLITIDATSYPPNGLGELLYKTHPRVGELISMDETGTMFEVVAVVHSATASGTDIYVKVLGNSVKVIKNICKDNNERTTY